MRIAWNETKARNNIMPTFQKKIVVFPLVYLITQKKVDLFESPPFEIFNGLTKDAF